eukprot:4608954-Amphidinium_carterae.1
MERGDIVRFRDKVAQKVLCMGGTTGAICCNFDDICKSGTFRFLLSKDLSLRCLARLSFSFPLAVRVHVHAWRQHLQTRVRELPQIPE